MPHTFQTVFGPLVIPSIFLVGLCEPEDDASDLDSNDEYEIIRGIDYVYWDGQRKHPIAPNVEPNAIYIVLGDEAGYLLVVDGSMFSWDSDVGLAPLSECHFNMADDFMSVKMVTALEMEDD